MQLVRCQGEELSWSYSQVEVCDGEMWQGRTGLGVVCRQGGEKKDVSDFGLYGRQRQCRGKGKAKATGPRKCLLADEVPVGFPRRFFFFFFSSSQASLCH